MITVTPGAPPKAQVGGGPGGASFPALKKIDTVRIRTAPASTTTAMAGQGRSGDGGRAGVLGSDPVEPSLYQPIFVQVAGG
jgi:hypothetical protein